jgi:hypothetical protein
MKLATPLSTLDKTIPPALSAVVSRMLAKKPEDRFQAPADVVTALAEWLPNAGAARVVAGLSGTDLAQTEKMKDTLTGMVQSGARRVSKKKNGARAKKKQMYWALGGVAAGVILAVVVGIIAFGGRNGTHQSDPPVANAPSGGQLPGAVPPGGVRVPTPEVPNRPPGEADGLVGHWKFTVPNLIKGVKDESGLKQTGIVVGTVDWAEIGDRAGLVFGDGGAMVRIPDNRRLRFTREESFTLTAWLKAPDELVEGRWEGVITKPHGRSEAWYGIWLGNIGGQPHWVFGSSFTNDPRANLTGSRSNGKWQHVCILQDATQGTRDIFVDGKNVTQGGPGRAKDCDGLGDLLIGNCVIRGANGTEGTEPFHGTVSEVRLYNRALTPDEILAAAQKKD